MKATELLQKQHRDIEALLERLRGAGQGEERTIREQLAESLVAHTAIEQELFYPAVHEVMPEEINEAIEEHALIDYELARLLHANTGDATFDARDAVLSEVVVRHLRKEETDIFRGAERDLGDELLHHLGERMQVRFRQVIEGGFLKILQRSLAENMPRTIVRAAATKKTAARRGAKKTKPARVTTKRGVAEARRSPAQKTAKRGAKQAQSARKTTQKATRGTRAGATRTRA